MQLRRKYKVQYGMENLLKIQKNTFLVGTFDVVEKKMKGRHWNRKCISLSFI